MNEMKFISHYTVNVQQKLSSAFNPSFGSAEAINKEQSSP